MNKVKKLLTYLSSTIFLIGIGYLAISNYPVIVEQTKMQLQDGNTVTDLMESAEDYLADELKQKYDFINLNGLMYRIAGINALNEVQLLKNGYLSDDYYASYVDQSYLANKIITYSQFLNEQGIEFLCIPVPVKVNFYDVQFMPGHEGSGNQYLNTTELIRMLNEASVSVIDLDSWYQENELAMEDVFFKTDMHWRPEIAFEVVKLTMERWSETGFAEYDTETLADYNWITDIYEDWFVGNHAKRVGIYYAGVDDISYIYPAYETDVTVERFNIYRGLELTMDDDAEHTLYYDVYLENKESFEANAYCLYLGDNYPLAYISNKLAVNDKKIVIIGDSFRLPYECFISTQFSEIYHIDMRYYLDGTFTEFVEEIEPDAVIMLFNGPYDSDSLNLGLDEWKQDFEDKELGEPIVELKSISLPETSDENFGRAISYDVLPGSYYMSVGNVWLSHNSDYDNLVGGCVQIALVNAETGFIDKIRYLQVEYDDEQTWLFTVPDDGNKYNIVLYDGVAYNTQGNSVQVGELCLRQFLSGTE